MKRLDRARMSLFVLLYAIALLLAGHSCRAQLRIVADCCDQAIRMQGRLSTLQGRYDSLKVKFDTLRKIDDRLLKSKDLRIKTLENQANQRIGQLVAEISGKDQRLDRARSELKQELLRFRLLGLGRRRWASRLLLDLQP